MPGWISAESAGRAPLPRAEVSTHGQRVGGGGAGLPLEPYLLRPVEATNPYLVAPSSAVKKIASQRVPAGAPPRLPDRWHAREAKTDTGGCAGQRPAAAGPAPSRSASPSILKPNTASEIASPGQMAIHGARYMYERPEPESMAPQEG